MLRTGCHAAFPTWNPGVCGHGDLPSHGVPPLWLWPNSTIFTVKEGELAPENWCWVLPASLPSSIPQMSGAGGRTLG